MGLTDWRRKQDLMPYFDSDDTKLLKKTSVKDQIITRISSYSFTLDRNPRSITEKHFQILKQEREKKKKFPLAAIGKLRAT